MRKIVFIVLLIILGQLAYGQKNSIQVKLVSTEDFEQNSYWGAGLTFNYKYGMFYQRQIKNKFHLIVGGLYSKIRGGDFSGDCADCPEIIKPKKGKFIQPKVALRYYLKYGKRFNHFVELGAASAHAKTEAEYTDYAWGQGNYKQTSFANSYGATGSLGTELNLAKNIFVSSALNLGYYQSIFKSVLDYANFPSGTSTSTNDNFTANLEFRLGYRF